MSCALRPAAAGGTQARPLAPPTRAAPSRPRSTPSSARTHSTQLTPRDGSAAPTPLNASYFDPDAYLKRLLKDTRLADLTNKHREMLAEVGSLDSDMQVGGGGGSGCSGQWGGATHAACGWRHQVLGLL